MTMTSPLLRQVRLRATALANRLPFPALWMFGLKQAWAALFGGLMLAAILFTQYVDLPWLARYDWLFLWAIAVQLFMVLSKLEKPHEVLTIVFFHLVGLGMEVFKTSGSIGSWHYPGEAIFHLGNVPLFSGFMYAAVGSYIARAWRVFALQFNHYPHRRHTLILALLIYVNFFTHHYLWDLRYLLFAAIVVLYGRVWVSYVVNRRLHRMPLIAGFFFVACFIWLSENIGTVSKAWLYPSQEAGWHVVSPQKIGSWLLLMVISFIMVDILYEGRRRLADKPLKPSA